MRAISRRFIRLEFIAAMVLVQQASRPQSLSNDPRAPLTVARRDHLVEELRWSADRGRGTFSKQGGRPSYPLPSPIGSGKTPKSSCSAARSLPRSLQTTCRSRRQNYINRKPTGHDLSEIRTFGSAYKACSCAMRPPAVASDALPNEAQRTSSQRVVRPGPSQHHRQSAGFCKRWLSPLFCQTVRGGTSSGARRSFRPQMVPIPSELLVLENSGDVKS